MGSNNLHSDSDPKNQGVRHSHQDQDDPNLASTLNASIREFNSLVEEIAILEMKLLFKQATANVSAKFTSVVKSEYGLEMDPAQITNIQRLIQDQITATIALQR